MSEERPPLTDRIRKAYRLMLTKFFCTIPVLGIGLALAAFRLGWGVREAHTTGCYFDEQVAIVLAVKGCLELMFWIPLLAFRIREVVKESPDVVKGAIENRCFAVFTFTFAVMQFIILIIEFVWCFGFYHDKKTICPLIDPGWEYFFANFGIVTTAIDGTAWIGAMFAFCFLMFET